MLNRKFKTAFKTVVAVFVIAAICGISMYGYLQLKQKEDAEVNYNFISEVERAKRATKDPCARVFYEFVFPTDLRNKATLVLMGREISPEDEPSGFMLRNHSDGRIELWTLMPAVQGFPTSSPWIKVGEKFSPEDPACRGK